MIFSGSAKICGSTDPDPGSQNLADPTDPDPKHWKQAKYIYNGAVYKPSFKEMLLVSALELNRFGPKEMCSNSHDRREYGWFNMKFQF